MKRFNKSTNLKNKKQKPLRKIIIHENANDIDKESSPLAIEEFPQKEKKTVYSPLADNLEKAMYEEGVLSYDPTCIRKKSNWGKGSNVYKFDNTSFEPKTLLNDIPDYSPRRIVRYII